MVFVCEVKSRVTGAALLECWTMFNLLGVITTVVLCESGLRACAEFETHIFNRYSVACMSLPQSAYQQLYSQNILCSKGAIISRIKREWCCTHP